MKAHPFKIILTIGLLSALTVSPPILSKSELPSSAMLSSKIANYKTINQRIASSGALTKNNIKTLKEAGFKVIIDLRTKAEGTATEENLVKKAGMQYFNIPVSMRGISQNKLTKFKKILKDTKGPVLLHCASGNRSAGMWAKYLISIGTSPDIAYKKARKLGLKLGFEKTLKSQ